MKKFALFLAVVLLFSCKKEKDETPAPVAPGTPATTNCFPLTIGSYWVYERFNLDTNGVETTTAVDSSYISRDTIISGKTYSVFVGSLFFPADAYYRRDSAGYLVDQFGVIYCSNTNYTDTLRFSGAAGIYNAYYKMAPGASLSVPAGTFTAFDYIGAIDIIQAGYPWDTSRNTHSYYADGVGCIRETAFFVSSPNYVGRKLVRYNIQ